MDKLVKNAIKKYEKRGDYSKAIQLADKAGLSERVVGIDDKYWREYNKVQKKENFFGPEWLLYGRSFGPRSAAGVFGGLITMGGMLGLECGVIHSAVKFCETNPLLYSTLELGSIAVVGAISGFAAVGVGRVFYHIMDKISSEAYKKASDQREKLNPQMDMVSRVFSKYAPWNKKSYD